MTITPRLLQLRAKALRTIEQRLDDLGERDGKGPLHNFETARIGNALADASFALSRERPPLIPIDWPANREIPLAEALALLHQARELLAPPRATGHRRNRTLAEIPKHYGMPQTYPRVRSP